VPYLQVLISAEQTVQASRILDALLAERLVTGGPILGGPAKFLWNFALTNTDVDEETANAGVVTVEQDYKLIVTYSRSELRDRLVEVAERASLEKICMVSFLPMEPNASLARFIDGCLATPGADLPAPQPVAAVAAVTYVPEEAIPSRTVPSTAS